MLLKSQGDPAAVIDPLQSQKRAEDDAMDGTPQNDRLPSGGGLLTRPGQLWRNALEMVCRRLEAEGFSPERALELGEGAIIACALHHVPNSVEEAYRLALGTARRSRYSTLLQL
jgi:hypothetical protein